MLSYRNVSLTHVCLLVYEVPQRSNICFGEDPCGRFGRATDFIDVGGRGGDSASAMQLGDDGERQTAVRPICQQAYDNDPQHPEKDFAYHASGVQQGTRPSVQQAPSHVWLSSLLATVPACSLSDNLSIFLLSSSFSVNFCVILFLLINNDFSGCSAAAAPHHDDCLHFA